MKKSSRLKLNNSGSMLVIVVISMAFIGILASLVLSVSLTNLQTKYVDTQSKTNFYSAEVALDEIETGLQAIISSELEKAYLEVLEDYASLVSGERNEKLKKCFIENVQASLWQGAGDMTHYNLTTLNSLLDNAAIAVVESTVLGNNDLEVMYTVNKPKEQYVLIKNLKIIYKNPANNYLTTISTDIRIVPPDIQFDSVVSQPAYCDYVLISDKTISADVPVEKCEVNGSVYANEKILAKSQLTKLIIKAENVVTRDKIEIADGAKLSIGDATNSANIWAKNIATTGTSTQETVGTFQGDCFVQDDLTLGVIKSNVSFRGGYYGYGYGNSPSLSSAMIINRSNCTLDLSDLKMLFLGGRSFIAPGTPTSSVEVATGESISSKMNQNAYLLPKGSILKAGGGTMGHNPILADEVADLLVPTDPESSVDMSYPTVDGKILSDFASGCEVIYYDGAVYFYLDFIDENKANEYYAAYYKENADRIDAALTDYGTKILKDTNLTPFSRLTNAGNIVLLNGANSEILNSTVTSFLPTTFENEAAALEKQYQAMKEKLMLTTTNSPAVDPASLYHSLINETEPNGLLEKIDAISLGADTASYPYLATDGSTLLGELILVNNPTFVYTVNASPTVPTIIVATGDVEMKCNSFNGLVIAKGNIQLATSADSYMNADADTVYKIIANSNAKTVFREFQDYTAPPVAGGASTSSQVDTDDLIAYENWKKN